MRENTNLALVSENKFGTVTADIYKDNNNEMYMTARQLGECLGYSSPSIAINKLVNRNSHIKDDRFSVLTNLVSTDGKTYNTRVFNEDGIYEIAFLANTEKAMEFRCWVRNIIKSLRKGELQIANNGITFSPEILDIAIQKYLPHPNILNENTWIKNVAQPLITSVAETFEIDSKSALNFIYDTMTIKCGFLRSCVITEYCDKYHASTVTVLNAIADSPIYRQTFTTIANDIANSNSEVNLVAENTIPDGLDEFSKLIYPLANKLNDNSCQYTHTLHKVYSKMKTPQAWKNIKTRNRCTTNKAVIMKNPKLMAEMKKVINQMVTQV